MSETREELLRELIKKLMFVTKRISFHHKLGAELPHKFDLSRPQARLFFTIADRKDGISVKELAEEFGITSGAVSQFVDALVTKHLVKREEDQNDRRVVRLKVVDEIKKHHDEFRNEYFKDIARRFEILDDKEILELITLLSKVNEYLVKNRNLMEKN